MKKFLIAGMMASLPFTVQAAGGYSAAGCGAGSIIFEGQSGLGPHILAATTNSFGGTQTFAMTSGTLGCDVQGSINSQASLYINANLDQIAADMSKGNGEALDALAVVLGIQVNDQEQFRSVMHSNFSTIFSNTSVKGADVADAVAQIMKNDATLSKYAS